jgi:hypothetical protein
MTTQKIIDNIQSRLEDLVSARFSGTYQNIKITCSSYDPLIDTDITITIKVTDQNGDPISGFTVPLQIDLSYIAGVTTNSNGVATYTYTCNSWGVHRIGVNSISAFITVTGWREITLTNGKLYVNGTERICELHYSKSHNLTTANTWTFIETITEISNYPPKTTVYAQGSAREVMARVFNTGSLQANYSAVGQRSITFNLVWHY